MNTKNTSKNSFFKRSLKEYFECALWTTSEYDENGECLGSLDENFGLEDISFQALLQSARELKSFIGLCNSEDPELIGYYINHLAPDGCDGAESFGYDFFLTRNGHGSGFWDRGNYRDENDQKAGKVLTELAESFGSADFYVDDKREKIHVFSHHYQKVKKELLMQKKIGRL